MRDAARPGAEDEEGDEEAGFGDFEDMETGQIRQPHLKYMFLLLLVPPRLLIHSFLLVLIPKSQHHRKH